MDQANKGPVAPHQMAEADWRAAVDRVRAGRALKPTRWPGGARCAVALSFDCDHETFELGRGVTAVGRLSWGEFGRRVGVPRILDLLEREEVKATFFVPAVAGLIDPSEPKRIVDAGHEVGMHGFIHENTSLLDPVTERDLMLRARDTLTTLTGREPVGFRAANWDLSDSTIAIVSELGLLYDSSLMADENCYELVVEGRPSGVVEIPVEWLRDDAVYMLFNRTPATRPWTPPDDVLTIFRRELDGAYREGGLFQLVCHPFVIGYRSRMFILEELIAHAKALGDVWFATHEEVARYVRDHA
ncbi:polysaccharide deacetylase family protein [Acuticoccus kandeliae]|uniref:polysaccharide deacetylase family protein n=1 Tax=Acuticoccus kandeliae TaxID=2073160 RepID=UPI001B3B9DDC|nr:polysaccharide deacetylase [Acuticoccus kandeliae]